MSHAILLQVPPFKKAFADAIPYVDYLFGNETEAVAFAESEGWTTKNVTQIAAKVVPRLALAQFQAANNLGFQPVSSSATSLEFRVTTHPSVSKHPH